MSILISFLDHIIDRILETEPPIFCGAPRPRRLPDDGLGREMQHCAEAASGAALGLKSAKYGFLNIAFSGGRKEANR